MLLGTLTSPPGRGPLFSLSGVFLQFYRQIGKLASATHRWQECPNPAWPTKTLLTPFWNCLSPRVTRRRPLDEIAAAAGISRRTFFYSKEDILLAYVGGFADALKALVIRTRPLGRHSTPSATPCWISSRHIEKHR